MTYIALIRGINVGGKTMIAMEDLRGLFESAGLTGVKTLLQSGNIVFTGKSGKVSAVEKILEKAAEKKFGRAFEFFIRDRPAWNKIIAGNPFPGEARRDPSQLLVLCTKAVLTSETLAALKAAIVGQEYFKAGERCLYIHYPDGIGRSKLTNALIERKLGASGTARNWNTVLKIAALLE